MGLAAPRKKTKISHDPNNTNWTRSTSGFGHKILSSQGWTPGSFLGARNAAHADMFTAASASHIKVLIKDDTLGLGARSKRNPLDEPTGLDAFKGLLGRLNGKSDVELQADQKKRDDAKIARYTAIKWQTVRFVSGGLLVQEKVDASSTRNDQQNSQNEPNHDTLEDHKGETIVGDDSDCETKNRKVSARKQQDELDSDGIREKKKKKKDKKRKRTEQREGGDTASDRRTSEDESGTPAVEPKEQLVQKVQTVERERRQVGRHMLRGRHIAQKRRALMDERSLNEIFMVKS